MTNIGNNPTIDNNNKVTIETYILDFNENVYGKEVTITFYKRLRDEKKFANIIELKEELAKNKEEVIKYFGIY